MPYRISGWQSILSLCNVLFLQWETPLGEWCSYTVLEDSFARDQKAIYSILLPWGGLTALGHCWVVFIDYWDWQTLAKTCDLLKSVNLSPAAGFVGDCQCQCSSRDAFWGLCVLPTWINLKSSLSSFPHAFSLSVAGSGPCINFFMTILPHIRVTLWFSSQELSKMKVLTFQPWIDHIYFTFLLLSELLAWRQIISFCCGM